MCDPVTIGLAAATAFQFSADIGAAKAEKATATYNADVAARNADADEARARDALLRGEQEVFKSRLSQAQVEGSQRAAFAARGLSLESGSPLRILMDTRYIGDVEATTLSSNAEREALSLREGAAGSRRESQFLRGRADSVNPLRSALPSLLMGASTVAASYYKYKPPVKTK
jgi:hypothetical protein